MHYYYIKNREKINPDNVGFITPLHNSISPITEWPGNIFTTEVENELWQLDSRAIKITKEEAQLIVNRSLKNKIHDAPNGELGNEEYRGSPVVITLP